MRYKLRTLLILLAVVPILFAASSVSFLTLPLRESDEREAARMLVAWIVEDRAMPGADKYPDAKIMHEQKHFFVICDYVAPEVSLSTDPRVQRIAQSDYDAVFKTHGFDGADYIRIERKAASKRVLQLVFSNVFGTLGAHGCEFEFRRKVWPWGLRARKSTPMWVS
jgi:hypothetical protein